MHYHSSLARLLASTGHELSRELSSERDSNQTMIELRTTQLDMLDAEIDEDEFRAQFGSCWGRMASTQRGSSVPSIAKTATSQSLRSNMSGDYHPLCHIQSRTVASGVTFKLNTLGQPLKRCESCVIGESNSSQVWRPSESSAWCSCTKGILCCCVQRESPVCWRTVTLRSILITYTS